MNYISEFLSLRCSGDVLNATFPIGNKIKEITEAMAVVKYIRRFALKRPMELTLYDLCAGNALGSVIAVHLLPIKYAFAIDKRERKRNWHLVKRFEYFNANIFDLNETLFDKNSIIIAIHACTTLSKQVVKLYNESKASHLILMPCCEGKTDRKYPDLIVNKLSKYVVWSWDLAQSCNGDLKIDEKIISPKNCLIVASK